MTLADRIEALDGPDRDIDAEIVRLVYGDDKDMKRCVERGTFNPTASIDAAMTLVPEGAHCGLGRDSGNDRHKSWAWVRWFDGTNWCETGCVWVSGEPALAICAAALRAKESDDAR